MYFHLHTSGEKVIDSPGGVMVQLSDRIDPSLNHFSCSVEIVGPVENRGLDTTTAVMAHDDDMADRKLHHTICKDGGGIEVPANVPVRDVTFGEEDTWGRSEDSPFRSSRVAEWAI